MLSQKKLQMIIATLVALQMNLVSAQTQPSTEVEVESYEDVLRAENQAETNEIGFDESILADLDEMDASTQKESTKTTVIRNGEKTITIRKIEPKAAPVAKEEKPAEVVAPVVKAKPAVRKKMAAPAVEISKPLAEVEAPKPESKSGLKLGYLYWGTANVKKMHDQTATINGLNVVSFGYSLENGLGLYIEPSFFINYNLEQGNTKHTVGNVGLKVTKGDLASILGFNLAGALRFYLPTGEAFRSAGTNGMLRADAKLSREFGGGFSAYYLLQPRYYLQSDRSKATFDEFGRLLDNAKANYGLRAINELGVGYEISKVLSLGQSIGLDTLFNYEDPGVGVDGGNTTTLDWGTEVGITVNKAISMTLAVSQSHEIGGEKGYSLFNGEEMTYHGIFSLKF